MKFLQVNQNGDNLKALISACIIINPKCISTDWEDIVDSKPRAVLKLLKPLIYTYFQRLSDKLTERDLVDWAKTRVLSKYTMKSFQDID